MSDQPDPDSRWALFELYYYYPSGGLDDLVKTFATRAEAEQRGYALDERFSDKCYAVADLWNPQLGQTIIEAP